MRHSAASPRALTRDAGDRSAPRPTPRSNGADCLLSPVNAARIAGIVATVPNLHLLISEREALAPEGEPARIHEVMTLPAPPSIDKSSIVEVFQAELVKHTASNTPCSALMLHRLPQLLHSTQAVLDGSSAPPNGTALALAYAHLHDELLSELEQKQLWPAVSEVRALARAIHHGIFSVFTADSPRATPLPDPGDAGTTPADGSTAGNAEQLELLRNVSHELRTPLQAILGWVSLLKGGQLPPEASVRALAAIERNAKLQSELITKVVESGTSQRTLDDNA